MTLGELIERLEKVKDKSKVIKKGFGEPMSWRGIYSELAFEPAENVTIQSMLDNAKSAIGKTFKGYKGGDYKMDTYSDVHISEYGCSYDFAWDYLIDYWEVAPNQAEGEK